jgi:tetratricopeptide (TPR) repeat protein
LTEALSQEHQRQLDALLNLREDTKASTPVWLRQLPGAPNAKHLLEHIDRLKVMESLMLPGGTERQVHQNRLLKLAREGGQMTAQHVRKLEDSVEYLNRGIWHHRNGSFDKALTDFDTSILITPTIAYAFCARASLRATCPDEPFRDGQMALDDARTALKLTEHAGQFIGDWRHRLYLQVLAAAYAENNDFQEAIVVHTRALQLALTNRSQSEIYQRLEQYRLSIPISDEKGLIRSGFSPERHAASSPAHPLDPTGK